MGVKGNLKLIRKVGRVKLKAKGVSTVMVKMRQPQTVEVKQCKMGVSWTALFFGCLVPLIRRDWPWGISMLVTQVVLLPRSLVAGLMVNVVMFSFYNKYYLQALKNKGYVLVKSTMK